MTVQAPQGLKASCKALLTLSLAAQHNLSQTGTNNVVASSSLNYFKQQIKSKLKDINVNPDIIDSIPVDQFVFNFSSYSDMNLQMKYATFD